MEKKGKVLLIEDDVVLARMYQKLLNNHGFKANIAIDGEKGLKQAIEEHPDLILLDIRMPKMDGITMLKLLRNDPWGAHVPVIILTNLDASDETVRSLLESHPAYYLVKSNTDSQLIIEKIEHIITESKTHTDQILVNS